MTTLAMPEEFEGTTRGALWEALAEGRTAMQRVAALEADNAQLVKSRDLYRERLDAIERDSIQGLSDHGYIVLREGGDVLEAVNNEHFIAWVRWVMTDGWAEMTAPTVVLSWQGPQQNPIAGPLTERLGPLRNELGLE